MTDEDRLIMTKANLEIGSGLRDAYISLLIKAAEDMIRREGIILDRSSMEDENIVVMYASYLYRKRTEAALGMPKMLRRALNDRLFSQKMGDKP